jgi:RHS repeat-associated protein
MNPTLTYHPDHLGSGTLVTDRDGEPYQFFLNLPYGETLLEQGGYSYDNPYKFNGKELDKETGLYYYGARYYDPSIILWLSVDPLAHKYPGLSPYNFVENNPIIHIDPDGREKIVVTGGEYTSDNRYKYNFVEPSIKQIKAYKAAAGTEQVTWVVMNVGYSDEAINTMRSVAKENGVSFVLLNSANELTNYLNSKSFSSADLSESRTVDQVTAISVFGHGFPGSMEFGYNQDTDGTNIIQSKFSFGIDDTSNLVEGAFNNPTIDIYTCNAMTPVGGYSFSKNSLGGAIHKKTGGTVSGYWGKTDYAHINDGQTFVDKLNRYWNGFNTRGSVNLPQAGTKTVDGQTYKSTKVTLTSPNY